MRKGLMTASLALAVMTTAVFAQGSAAIKDPPSPSTEPREAVNARFERFRQESHAPGLVWGIVANGQLAYSGALGVQDIVARRPVTTDTVFRIASMSKAFTALALLKLRDAGKLSLDAPVESYVPQTSGWRYPTGDSARLRVRDLLGHTAGLGPDDPWSDRQQPMSERDFTALLKNGVSFNQPPETTYDYSSLGYALLGRVITNVSGLRYDHYIENAFLRPLAMDATGYEIATVPADRLAVGYRWENEAFVQEPAMGNGVFGAMGGVHTSARDYARWVAFLLSAWPARDDRDTGLMSRATVRELAIGTSFPRLGSRPRPGNAGPCAFATVYSAGFNVVRDCDLGLVLTHNGGYPGYGSTVLLMPEYGIGIFAFVNRTYDTPTGAVFDVAQMLKDAGLLKAAAQRISPALAHAYAVARTMYQSGNVRSGQDGLSGNFLMDRSAENWDRQLSHLKADLGACGADEPLTATGLRTGSFSWQCEHGAIHGTLELSPTNPPLIQALTLTPAGRK